MNPTQRLGRPLTYSSSTGRHGDALGLAMLGPSAVLWPSSGRAQPEHERFLPTDTVATHLPLQRPAILQSSCIAFGTMPLPMIGGCRPDRGPTRCADMTTPFGGMGVCQCAQGICASNGVCMDNSFLGLGGLMGANKNFDESQQLQAPPPGGYQPAMYPSSGTPMPMQMPFFGRLYQASEHVVPPEDHSPVLLGLGSFACAFLALVGLMTRRCGFRQASHHYRVLSSEAVDEDVALSDS
ncbi:unnamed protein product [Durusdinium trenchii]|uniref:Uncharacterized protein n=1 Tax=Durusdinium trenchii TaxID=1381693 RepID=A0ABP0NQW3_9DINO